MCVNLKGNYNNLGKDTLRLLKLAAQDGDIDSKEVTGIEIASKSDKNYSKGEQDLVKALRNLTKDGNTIKDIKLSNFDPIQDGASFNIKIKDNNIEVSKGASANFPNQISTSALKYNQTSKDTHVDGIVNVGYETNPKNEAFTVRASLLDPAKIDISFLVSPGGTYFENLKKKDYLLVSHGTFMVNYQPQGDVKGINPNTGKETVYHLSGNNAAANGRYSLVDNDSGLSIRQGGLSGATGRDNKALDPKQCSGSLGGLALLFDGQNFKNRDEFLNFFKDKNDNSMLNNVFRLKKEDFPNPKGMLNKDLDKAHTARGAVGITADGKVIMVHFGEGRFRNTDGPDLFTVYQALKQMGAVKAVLLDGGGAPVLMKKDANGNISETIPDAGYEKNGSFITARPKK